MKRILFILFTLVGLSFSQFQNWDGNAWKSFVAYGSYPEVVPMAARYAIVYDDFIGNLSYWNNALIPYVSGAGTAIADVTPTDLSFGQVSLSTGTTTSGRAGIAPEYATSFLTGNGTIYFRSRIKATNISTTAERFILYSGLGNSMSGNPTEGAYFRYSDAGVTGGRWKCWTVRAAGSLTDSTTSGITLVADTWYILEIVSTSTYIDYFVNGNLVVHRTTNLPTAATGIVPINIIKLLGTTARLAHIDYVYLQQKFTTPR